MDRKARRKVLRSIPNGLFVMTARDGDTFGAATITWLTQCSFEPPRLVAAVRPDTGIHLTMEGTDHVVVHALADDQEGLAGSFFSAPEVGRETDGTPTLAGYAFEPGPSGVPILADAPAWMACQIVGVHDVGGDHHLVVLEVVDVALRREFRPLTVADSPWEYGG